MHSILGDYQQFTSDVVRQLQDIGINVSGRPVSHIAFRTASIREYDAVHAQLQQFCSAEVENTWNGRPIAKLLLREPLAIGNGLETSLVELIPIPHRGKYPMGLEHIGFVLGFGYDDFARRYATVLSGQLENGPWCRPWYRTLPDGTAAKFYRYSLKDVVELEGGRFEARAAAPVAKRRLSGTTPS